MIRCNAHVTLDRESRQNEKCGPFFVFHSESGDYTPLRPLLSASSLSSSFPEPQGLAFRMICAPNSQSYDIAIAKDTDSLSYRGLQNCASYLKQIKIGYENCHTSCRDENYKHIPIGLNSEKDPEYLLVSSRLFVTRQPGLHGSRSKKFTPKSWHMNRHKKKLDTQDSFEFDASPIKPSW